MFAEGVRIGTLSWNDHLTIQTVVNYSRGNLGAARNLLRNEAFDVVHIHSSVALPSLILARTLGKVVSDAFPRR